MAETSNSFPLSFGLNPNIANECRESAWTIYWYLTGITTSGNKCYKSKCFHFRELTKITKKFKDILCITQRQSTVFFFTHAQFYRASLGRKRWPFMYGLLIFCSSTLFLCASNKYWKATMCCRLSSILWESYKDQSTTFCKNLKKIYRLSMRTLASFCSGQGLLPASVPLLWHYYSHFSLLSCPRFFLFVVFWGALFVYLGIFFFIVLSEILQL